MYGWRASDLYRVDVHVAPHRLHPDPTRGGEAVDARHGGLETRRQGNIAAPARIKLRIEASEGWGVVGRPMVLAGAIILSHEVAPSSALTRVYLSAAGVAARD
jgi:hypothetical protein